MGGDGNCGGKWWRWLSLVAMEWMITVLMRSKEGMTNSDKSNLPFFFPLLIYLFMNMFIVLLRVRCSERRRKKKGRPFKSYLFT